MTSSTAALAASRNSGAAEDGSFIRAERAPARGRAIEDAPALVRWLLPTPADMILLVIAAMVPIAFGKQLLNTDGDLARHLANGAAILRGGLFHTDPFSYTRPGAPFTHFEWLSSVLFAGIYRVAGLAGISAMAGLVLAGTYALLYRIMRRRGVDPVLASVAVMAAALLGSIHWLARPHLFTMLGVVVVLGMLERERRTSPLLFAPLFALWANLHGGFVYGLLMIFAYFAGAAAEWLAKGDDAAAARALLRSHGAALALGAAGSLVTPSGLSSIGAVAAHMGQTYLLDTTVEFMSPDFHHAAGKPFLFVLLLLVGALAVRGRRPAYGRLFLVLGTTALALYARRNIPLFGLSAIPVAAIDLDPEWRRLPSRLLARLRGAMQQGEAAARGGVWAALAIVGLSAAALNHGRVGAAQVLPDRFEKGAFPVDAVRTARAAGLQGRMFNAFTWGGYITYAWPEQKVFIDGQTAFFGEPLTREFWSIQGLQPGWREALDRWRVSMVIFPTKSALISQLSADPAWRRWYADSTATILVRPPGPAAGVPTTGLAVSR